MSGEQRAMLQQLQQKAQSGQYPSMGNPILGLQIPQIEKFAPQYPEMATSTYVLPFYRQHQAPYDWVKMFQAALGSGAPTASRYQMPGMGNPPVLMGRLPVGGASKPARN